MFFFKWPPVAILVKKSLLTISDQYHNFYFCDSFLQNGCRWPFWSKNHFFNIISDQCHNFYFVIFFTKWLPVAILDVQNSLSMAFLAISDQYQTFFKTFTKWPPAPILDVRNSLLIAFFAISDRYAALMFFNFWTK